MIDNQQQFIDDEIDLMPYFKALFKNYKLFIGAFFTAIILSFAFSKVLPKKYSASVTFIIPNNTAQSSLSSGLLGFNQLFNQSFSSQQASVYSSYLPAIVESYRIKDFVAKSIIKEGFFKSDKSFNLLDEQKQIKYVISKLKLSKKIDLENDTLTQVYQLSFSNGNQAIVLPVINAYISALITFNEVLQIDSQLLEIIVLDEAIFPIKHSFPNAKKLFVITFVLLFGLVFVSIILKTLVNQVTINKNKVKDTI
jgi:uncharacterized protein involved in exopolysaccharide biosynthesis